MRIENTGVEEIEIDLKPLDHIMGKHAFIRAGQWDYHRLTYDYKIDSKEKNVTYYIRIQGVTTEGNVDSNHAVIKLMTPLIAKHYYPHGLYYGDEEDFSDEFVARATDLVQRVVNEVKEFVG